MTGVLQLKFSIFGRKFPDSQNLTPPLSCPSATEMTEYHHTSKKIYSGPPLDCSVL